MILHPHQQGWVAVRQSAHALMAFQLAEHWGNRTTPRPAPRAEVLAAVLLHDAGWDEREEHPRLAGGGLPVAFNSLSGEEHEEVWSACVARAAARGRYCAYLVSHHVTYLARAFGPPPSEAFLAREEERQRSLAQALQWEPRYAQLFRSGGDLRNRAILRLADAVAVLLATGAEARALPGLPQRSGEAELRVRRVGERVYRLRPWPFAGRRLRVHAEGLWLRQGVWASEEELQRDWAAAPVLTLTWVLLAPGTPAPGGVGAAATIGDD